MTPEEKAVIGAAENWHDNGGHCPDDRDHTLHAAVRALRQSRQPKPRWGVVIGDRTYHVTFDGGETSIRVHRREGAEAIAEALNRAADSERGEP